MISVYRSKLNSIHSQFSVIGLTYRKYWFIFVDAVAVPPYDPPVISYYNFQLVPTLIFKLPISFLPCRLSRGMQFLAIRDAKSLQV